jgi:two-component system osmolarity sensor histidine kinase EnvZ
VRRVRPTALTRALANLIDNALAHGAPPLRLELRGEGEVGFAITVWDQGAGIPALAWSRALEPFQRLDPARGDQGHCGLGLAIAERIGRDHGGGLESHRGPHGFGVTLRGRSVLEDS